VKIFAQLIMSGNLEGLLFFYIILPEIRKVKNNLS